ncbi:EpsG family protein [Vibrio rarus]|uniref:EpsG family protein n=1 Tax=Vibrio rarus TaxID=413403 RepID=UPI0036F1A997
MFIFRNELLTLYFLVYICLLLLSLYANYKKSKIIDNTTFVLSVIIFILFIYSRDGYGVDEPTYLKAYVDYVSSPSNFRFDYSFRTLYWLLSVLDVSPTAFNEVIVLLMLAFVSCIVWIFTSSQSRSITLVLLLFSSTYLDLFFNAYRQAYALLFLLFSFSFLFRQKLALFFVLAVISFGFHWSVLVVYILYIISRLISLKWLKYILYTSIIFTLIALFRPLGIIGSIVYIVNFLPSNLFGDNLNRILMYLQSTEYSFYSLNLFGRIPTIMPVMVALFFSAFFFESIKKSRWLPLIILLSVYCVLLLEMAFSFRNYYWLLPLFPFLCADFINETEAKVKNTDVSKLIIVGGLHCSLTIISFFSSPLLPLMFRFS